MPGFLFFVRKKKMHFYFNGKIPYICRYVVTNVHKSLSKVMSQIKSALGRKIQLRGVSHLKIETNFTEKQFCQRFPPLFLRRNSQKPEEEKSPFRCDSFQKKSLSQTLPICRLSKENFGQSHESNVVRGKLFLFV